MAEIGDGIPFCDAAMANVAEFMGRFEGQLPPDDRYGGVAVVGSIGELTDGMNGHVSQLYSSTQHQNFVNQMTLVQYDGDLSPIPYLAESWEVSDDNTEITFHVRDDVYWHDGELTDAYDVAYTYERAIDPATGFPNSTFWTHYDQGPGGVEVVDSFTVKFRMRPHADFIDPWRTTTIMPRHLLEDVPSAELRQHPYGTVCPVGNGPFVFVQHRQDASWTFQASPAFPAGLGGRPFLDRLVYRIILEQTTLLTELLTENIRRPDRAPAGTRLRRSSTRTPWSSFAILNGSTSSWGGTPVVPSSPTRGSDRRSRRVRNRQEIVDALLQGYGRVANGSVPPFHWAYNESVGADAAAYDQDAARALLDEAGWIDRDGDGVRENAQGVPPCHHDQVQLGRTSSVRT